MFILIDKQDILWKKNEAQKKDKRIFFFLKFMSNVINSTINTNLGRTRIEQRFPIRVRKP